jgi:hypothetical protein
VLEAAVVELDGRTDISVGAFCADRQNSDDDQRSERWFKRERERPA